MPQPRVRFALLIGIVSSGFAAAQPQPDTPRTAPLSTGAPTAIAAPERPPRSVALWLGHVESDNVARTVVGEDGSYDSAGFLLGLQQTSTRLEARIDADLEYRRYSLEDLESETVGTLSAAADVELVQNRFLWSFTDNLGQGITDPFAGIGPDNRQKLNVIGTGPRFDLPLGPRNSLEIRGTYSERRFDESNNVDSDSTLSELGIYRQTSPTARFGLVASSNEVEYVDVVAPEYQIDRLMLRYEKELATGRVLADLGTNEISTGAFSIDEPRYNLVWTRALSARSELSIRAMREFTDAGDVLGNVLTPGLEGASFTDVLVSPNPLEQRRFSVSYLLTMSRTVVSAEIGSWEDAYVGDASLNNDSTSLRLSFIRTISQQLSFGVGYNRLERDFADALGPQADGDDSWTGAWLNRSLGRRFSLGIAISSYDRTGFQSYDERRYELRFGYSPTDSGTATMATVGR